MIAFLVELAIFILVMLCLGHEQRPWVFLGGGVVIVTPWWIALGLGSLFAVAVVARWLHRAYRRNGFADAPLSRLLTVDEWRDFVRREMTTFNIQSDWRVPVLEDMPERVACVQGMRARSGLRRDGPERDRGFGV